MERGAVRTEDSRKNGGPAASKGRASVSIAGLCAGKRPPVVPSVHLRVVLEKNGNDPLWHAAAADVSGELAFLRTSLRQWPDSPDLLTRGMNLESTPEARAAHARRLTDVDPDNSSGLYGLASYCAETGDFSTMVQYLRAAMKSRAPAGESPEVASLRRELWMAAGFPETEAVVYNSCATENHLRHALTLMRPVDALLKRLTEMPPGEEREDLAMLGVACAEHFRQTDGVALNLLAMKAQISLLREIDPGAAFGETGNTAGEQLRLLKSDMEALREEFSLLEEKTRDVRAEDFTDPSNFWMALAEYNAFRRLGGAVF